MERRCWLAVIPVVAIAAVAGIATLEQQSLEPELAKTSSSSNVPQASQRIGVTAKASNPTATPSVADAPAIGLPSGGTADPLIDEILRFESCYYANACEGPDDGDDPMAMHFHVASRISSGLDDILATDSENLERVGNRQRLAERLISFPDGHVQVRALTLLGTLPPARSNVPLIIEALDGHYDDKLFEMALVELQRYPRQYQAIDDFLVDALRRGSPRVSQVVAKRLHTVLRPDNIARYQILSTELDPHTAKARLLRASLEEYRLRIAGG